MKTVSLGTSQYQVPNLIGGMMRIGELTDTQIRELYETARAAGIDFFDHADLYGFHLPHGGRHWCEQRFSQALKLSAHERDQIVLQSKTGIVDQPWGYDNSYEHIVRSAQESLRALRTDYLDVLLLHRPDALVQAEEVARAFDYLHSHGMVRGFGVSNHTPRQIELLKTAVAQPILVNQLQLSLTYAPIISQGLVANMAHESAAASVDGGGVLDYCRVNRITVQAWSPLQAGHHPGAFLGSAQYPELNRELERLATRYCVTPSAIAVAWITRHPADMQVVLGSTNPQRVLEAAQGSDLPLTRGEWYGLMQVAGHRVP